MSIDSLLLTSVGLLLVLLNGFFVAAEFAIVKLRRTQAEELARTHGLRGRVLRTVRTHLDAYLSACQLGITLASLGLWMDRRASLRPPCRTPAGTRRHHRPDGRAQRFICHRIRAHLVPAHRRRRTGAEVAGDPPRRDGVLEHCIAAVRLLLGDVPVHSPAERCREHHPARAGYRAGIGRRRGSFDQRIAHGAACEPPSRRTGCNRDPDPHARPRPGRPGGRRCNAPSRRPRVDRARRDDRRGALRDPQLTLYALSGSGPGYVEIHLAFCTSRIC